MIKNYVKLALKVLARRKAFTAISLFGIILTLVVLMVATAILDNIFAPRAPESRLDRALGVYIMNLRGEESSNTGPPGFKLLDRTLRDLPGAERTSIFSTWSPAVMYHDGRKIETHLRRTDGAYWQILDFDFIEGAPFTQADDDNAAFVAVITTDMRDKLFGGASALGKPFEVDGQRFRVVGVVPPVPMTRFAAFSEIWVPTGTMKSPHYRELLMGGFSGLVLAKSVGDLPRLRREYRTRLDNFRFDTKDYDTINGGLQTTFETFAHGFFGNAFAGRQALMMRLVFALAAVLFITLPTMNLVSLNLSRIMERASEIGVRKAFGASSRSLVGQFIVENVVLTAIGGAAGFVLTLLILRAINAAEFLPYAVFDVNLRIFGLAMLIAVVFGIVSGAWPAWRMSRMHPVNALRGGAE